MILCSRTLRPYTFALNTDSKLLLEMILNGKDQHLTCTVSRIQRRISPHHVLDINYTQNAQDISCVKHVGVSVDVYWCIYLFIQSKL